MYNDKTLREAMCSNTESIFLPVITENGTLKITAMSHFAIFMCMRCVCAVAMAATIWVWVP